MDSAHGAWHDADRISLTDAHAARCDRVFFIVDDTNRERRDRTESVRCLFPSSPPAERNSERFAGELNGLLSTFVYNTHAQWACITTTRFTTTNKHLATLDMLAEAHRLDSHAW